MTKSDPSGPVDASRSQHSLAMIFELSLAKIRRSSIPADENSVRWFLDKASTFAISVDLPSRVHQLPRQPSALHGP